MMNVEYNCSKNQMRAYSSHSGALTRNLKPYLRLSVLHYAAATAPLIGLFFFACGLMIKLYKIFIGYSLIKSIFVLANHL